MKKGKANPSERQKNQLIPRASEEPTEWYVPWIKYLGLLLLIGGVVWAVALFWSVAPPFRWLVGLWPAEMVRADALFESSHFGHAFLGPIELATLGTIVLSFVHVFHQLREQRHMERTRFQPVVTCVAMLTFDVVGTAGSERVMIVEPYLKLRIKNLGDSPATFIDIQIKSLHYFDSKGSEILMTPKLKLRSVKLDSLGKHDASGIFVREAALSSPSPDPKRPHPLQVTETALIDGILRSGDDKNEERIELTVSIRHENVMQLEYTAEGTFVWSRGLCETEFSESEQFEYIETFRKDRGDGTGRSSTVGRCFRRNQTLQAALKHQSISRAID